MIKSYIKTFALGIKNYDLKKVGDIKELDQSNKAPIAEEPKKKDDKAAAAKDKKVEPVKEQKPEEKKQKTKK